jgi:4-amino-4-deoxy-L-arabinose transferase-like glycosyltransferase
MATVTPPRPAMADAAPVASPPTSPWWRRAVLGPETAPRWARPSLLGLLAVTAFLYLWDLSASGWANSFYAAAVQAGSESWKAAFFGSFDASNFITVDKPPAALWVMDISVRIFGLNSWSLLAPQALEGVASVAIIYAAVRRWFGHFAGLVAGAVLALTPVAALMFRFDNPDSLLVLLLAGAAYAVVRTVESGKTRWLLLAGALIGTGFITKMLQAFLVVPVFALVILVAAPGPVRRRIGQLAAATVALLAASLWWVVVVMAVPAADRPYIGGSTDNSLWNLIFGYNGFGRLDGKETGSVGGGGGSAGNWGPTGITRLFNSDFGGDISWLLPAALILIVAGIIVSRRAARTDRTRAACILWGGSLLVTGLTFSLSKGIIHPYYTVALAPTIGAVVGIGASRLWAERTNVVARAVAAGILAVTAIWSWELLDRSPSWHPWLRWSVLIVGLVVAAAMVAGPAIARRVYLGGAHRLGDHLHYRGGRWLASLALIVALAGPAAYTADTVTTAHTGAIPTAGPTVAAGPGGGFGGGGFGGGSRRAGKLPGGSTGGFGGGRTSTGRPGSTGTGGSAPTTGASSGSRASTGTRGGFGGSHGAAGGQGGGGGVGGLLGGAGSVSSTLKAALEKDAGSYSWVLAAIGSENASTYQLATDKPVMAIGGFNGTDPAPSLAAFELDVKEHKIHYFIADSTEASSSSDASQITAWVEAHFKAETIGGTSVYDLSTGASS